jgi:hypothetical protein
MTDRKLVESAMETFPSEFWEQATVAVFDGYAASFREVNITWSGSLNDRRGDYESPHAWWMHGDTRKAYVDRLPEVCN